MNLLVLLGGLVAAAAIALVLLLLWLPVRKGRRLGTRGLVQRSRLECPKCRRRFDLDWIAGASVTAIRLGKGRYMACPLCHHWSYFNLYDTMIARPPEDGASPGSA